MYKFFIYEHEIILRGMIFAPNITEARAMLDAVIPGHGYTVRWSWMSTTATEAKVAML